METLDIALLRLINHSLANRVFDVIMPYLSGKTILVPLILLAVVALWIRGGRRGRMMVVMSALSVLVVNEFVCAPIKAAIQRPRPALTIPDVRLPDTEPGSPKPTSSIGSMPSAHSASMAALAAVAFVYFRKSWRLTVPLALSVGFSRVYLGVHYPSDVLAGLVAGAVTGWLFLLFLDLLWRWAGGSWFPLWWERLPSLRLRQLRKEAA